MALKFKNAPKRAADCRMCGVRLERGVAQNNKAFCGDVCRKLRDSFYAAKAVARRRGIDWNLTMPQFLERKSALCSYCGSSNHGYRSTLDRVDSAGDYTPDNVVAACRPCNTQKNSGHTVGLIASHWLEAVTEAHGSPGGEA
jgi:hypothetical protein